MTDPKSLWADAGAITNRMGETMAQPDYAGVSKLRGREPTPCCDAAARLARIESICRPHATSASNAGAHALATKIIKIIEDKCP